MIIFLFWFSILFVAYTYFGYPLLIRSLARQKAASPVATLSVTQNESYDWPRIGIIVPVHNEARHINNKIKNLRELDYPKDKLTITFVSDGSEDKTNDLLRAQQDIQSIDYHPRQGKPTALNTAVEHQTAEILIFTDARQALATDSVKKLVATLQQPGIGAVSGELCFGTPTDVTAQNVGLYWKYEKAIRHWESQYHSVAGVTGALYAIYRKDYVPLYPDALLDDFEVPIQILKMGKRIVFEPGAYVYDQAQTDAASEKTRKIRTLTGNFQSFAHNKWLFTRKNPILWQFLSHKVFRLLVPYFLLLALATNLALAGPLYNFFLFCQLAFYGCGVLAIFHENIRRFKVPNLAAVFIKLNWAAVIAFIQYRQKRISVRWEKTS